MQFFKWTKREKSMNRKGYNQVAYIRRGKDTIEPLGAGFTSSKKKIPTVWVTTKSGDKYEIPVDPKTGKVPNEYLYARFLDESRGSRNGRDRNVIIDIGKDADTIFEIPAGGFTPQQLIESGWWQYPNECDILDIDDTGAASLAKELEEASKTAQSRGKKIIFLMPDASAERARGILARDFNSSEIKKAVRNGGIIIKEGNAGRGASGCYISRQETSSLKTPVIILKPGWDEETLVHEFTHHLRHVDETREGLTRTPLRLNAAGERMPYRGDHRDEMNSALNLEEAATVAESLVRIQEPSTGANGYYAYSTVHGKEPYERYMHDRKALVPEGEKPQRGRKAEKKVTGKFKDTSISHLGYFRPGSNAGKYYDKRKAAGTLPKAVKPVKKKASTVKPTGTGKVPATASRNRAKIKSRR